VQNSAASLIKAGGCRGDALRRNAGGLWLRRRWGKIGLVPAEKGVDGPGTAAQMIDRQARRPAVIAVLKAEISMQLINKEKLYEISQCKKSPDHTGTVTVL
jgi:hypothetical protein